MSARYCTNYNPAFSHPIGSAMLFILAVSSLLVVITSTTTFVRYGYMLPPLFHLLPVALVLLLATSIRLFQNEQGTYEYSIRIFGISVQTKTFDRVTVTRKGKLYTLIGHDAHAIQSSTYITESAKHAIYVFRHFGELDSSPAT